MILLRDYQGLEVRLTEERLEHILEHPEMAGSERAIQETLRNPDRVLESLFDTEARLYYRFYRETGVGAKYLCVVVKITHGDAFVLTAYLTDSVKRGWRLWPETE
jgi:phage-Barnase-EndoU-ColicinE5/D-RelE like nuclease2